MYFLKKQVNLIMVIKFFIKLFLFFFFFKYSYSEIIYNKNDIIITQIDIETYQQLYKENYNYEIIDTPRLNNIFFCIDVVIQ